MSGKLDINDIFSSVDFALGLVADRDSNPELDRSCYKDPTQKPVVNIIPKNIENVVKRPEVIITDINVQKDKEVVSVETEKEEISVSKAGTYSKTYISRSMNPPNKGNVVKSIDDLVDKIKWRHNLHMFSSVPSIKAKIDPSKFSGLVRKNVPTSLILSDKDDSEFLSSEISEENDEVIPFGILGSPQKTGDNNSQRIIYPKNVSDPSDSFEIVIDDNNNDTSTSTNYENNNDDDIIYIDIDYPDGYVFEKSVEEIFDYDNIVEERTNVNQSWSVIDVATKATPPGWVDVFESCLPEIEHISKSLAKDEADHGAFYPQKADLFKAFDMCPLQNVKVVIIGQDPYHNDDHNGYPVAMGMSFSVRKGNAIPSSLNNIYKELSKSSFEVPGHGDLSSWARQGVLLLNMCLTVRAHQPKSHKSLWMGFVAKIIASINAKNPNCIYVMWGREAERIQTHLNDRNIKLVAPHPSGLSANKGFIGCGHFVKINEHLETQGKKKINWSL